MIDWEIFYDNGETFNSEDGSPEEAPGRGVIAIVCPDKIQEWVIVSKFDYYIFRPDGWYGVDQFGLYDYLIDPGFKIVKFGRTIDNAEFQRIHQSANIVKLLLKEHRRQANG